MITCKLLQTFYLGLITERTILKKYDVVILYRILVALANTIIFHTDYFKLLHTMYLRLYYKVTSIAVFIGLRDDTIYIYIVCVRVCVYVKEY